MAATRGLLFQLLLLLVTTTFAPPLLLRMTSTGVRASPLPLARARANIMRPRQLQPTASSTLSIIVIPTQDSSSYTTSLPADSGTWTTSTAAATASATTTPSQARGPWRGGSMLDQSEIRLARERARGGGSMVTTIILVLIGSLVLGLFLLRLWRVQRSYPLSFRSFFIPSSGLKIRYLNIDIAPATPRAPTGPPPSYSRGFHAVFRPPRRGHDTNGVAIEEGGQRVGSRDEDDIWEGESLDEVQEEKEGLPRYAVDVDLPGYSHSLAPGVARANGLERQASVGSSGSEASTVDSSSRTEAIMTSREYEQAIRNAPQAPERAITREISQIRNDSWPRAAWNHASWVVPATSLRVREE
ncbi:BZ3500_MvSof-1268-A1-R1_Chr1-1g00944 [Microbotryum saponariae]|uniref:BZ3500_MvSof-1268-A1-R1_Chr1-1g00944 protein n=1 Tax=Microbotryum saponariae TaxID=289078 RepID=A0A2X0MMD8_9BASI|nr:BZ3500_MvSof-1268-A1-R1_Chr1-1g00944 [Microbotryum saponariae]SCZ92995.1 BZ3501_MvSof-1269-A2-R1_Chr1-1g00541 [Microbotryum saponariae]